jgi:hypothetical protein
LHLVVPQTSLLSADQPESVAAQGYNAENYTNGEFITGAAASLKPALPRLFAAA